MTKKRYIRVSKIKYPIPGAPRAGNSFKFVDGGNQSVVQCFYFFKAC